MYTLALRRDFSARHYLVGADWGLENEPHAHDYRVEIRLRAENLDDHGYLIDLDLLEQIVDNCIAAYRDRLLNDLPDFDRVNPSIERFANRFHSRFVHEIGLHRFQEIEIRMWENEEAWASYRDRSS